MWLVRADPIIFLCGGRGAVKVGNVISPHTMQLQALLQYQDLYKPYTAIPGPIQALYCNTRTYTSLILQYLNQYYCTRTFTATPGTTSPYQALYYNTRDYTPIRGPLLQYQDTQL